MKTNYRHTSLVVIIVAALVAFMLPTAAGAQTEPTTLYVNPATSSATTCPSSTIEVAISVGDVVNLTAFHLEISFDPAVIQVDSIVPAEFIIGEGEDYLPEISNEIDNLNGFISWGLAKQGTGGDPNPVSGDGDLIEITLHALVPNDSSEIDIDAANSMLVNWPDAFEIPFTATDGVVNTSSCPPTDIDLSNNKIQENRPAGTTIGTFRSTHPDGHTTFTYRLVDTEHYPDNAAFTITGRTLKSAVSFNYEVKNSYHIRVRSTDEWGAYYEEVFSILIIDVNDAPVLAPIGDKTPSEGVLLTFDAEATDEDEEQTLTFSLSGAPSGASIDPTTGVFTWTPGEDDGGQSFTFTVCVSDGALRDCETITLTVSEVNIAPVLAEIGDKEVDELALLTFTATASDADIPAQTLVFSLADGAEGDVPEGAVITAAGAFTWTPTEAQGPGEYTFDVCVSDGALSDCDTISVTVSEVNVAPVLAEIGDKEVDELALLTFTATASDADIPVQTLVFSLAEGAEGEVPEGAVITPAGVFSWTPTDEQGPGEYTFDVCVSDGALSDCETITVTVNAINHAPVAEDMEVETDEDTSVEIELEASDFDGDDLTFTVVSQPAHGTLSGIAPELTYTPAANYYGLDSFKYKANDGKVDSNEATVNITITPIEDAPIAEDLTVETLENQAVEFVLVASDPDGDLLTYRIVESPLNGNLSCAGPNCVYTPETGWNGEDSFTYIANDGELDSNEATVEIIVHPLPIFRIYLPLIMK